jgi:hypothetical protein
VSVARKLCSSIALSATSFALLAAACSSDPSSHPAGERPQGDVTFTKDVEPLLQDKCQRCHREGGGAPFSLVTYEEATAMGHAARAMVHARTMPPWGAFDDETCQVTRPFQDDLRLTDAQIALFGEWVDGGMPLGDPDARRPQPAFPSTELEGKTHTLAMAQDFEVPGATSDDIRCFPIDPGFSADTWVGGVNVVPGNPRVVHHVIVFTDPNSESVDNAGAEGSYPCFGGPLVSNTSLLMAWAPGTPATGYADAGIKIAAGSKLVMQVHYHPAATTETDRTRFELRVLPEPPPLVAQILLLGNAEGSDGPIKLLPGPNDPPEGPAFIIPPNVSDHTESMEVVMPEMIRGFPFPELALATVGAHMHWAGVDMKIEIERSAPSEAQPASECLLGTPKYDFNWQRGYTYDVPFEQLPTVRAGDKLRFTCTYDNTPDNPNVRRAMAEARLSSPPEIRLGENTFDEMCLGVLVALRPMTPFD